MYSIRGEWVWSPLSGDDSFGVLCNSKISRGCSIISGAEMEIPCAELLRKTSSASSAPIPSMLGTVTLFERVCCCNIDRCCCFIFQAFWSSSTVKERSDFRRGVRYCSHVRSRAEAVSGSVMEVKRDIERG